MVKRKIPPEVAGFKNQSVYVFDHIRNVAGFRLLSVVNDDYEDDDILPWDEDSSVEDCPF